MNLGRAVLVVTKNHLAPVLKTGSVNVLSTAIMAALMEEASCMALKNSNMNHASVGVSLNLIHRKPSPIGAHISAVSRITSMDKKSVCFDIEAFDDTGKIGMAQHKRVFVDKEEFEKKCYEKAKNRDK